MTEPQAKRLKLATPGNVVVDPDGDVLLLIGTDNSNPELSIQVSSKVLSVASKVFRAMFSRNFREGSQLALAKGSMPVKIPLPDDNPDAILTLCKVLHFDTADLATTHDIAKLQGFAVVADKYDCVLACIFYGRVWLTLFWEDSCALPEILALAYLFDDPHTFKKVSATLLLSGDGVDAIRKFQKTTSIKFPVDVCGKSHHFSLFTSSFINGQIDALAKKRSNMEQMVSAELMLPISTLTDWDDGTKEIRRDFHRNHSTAQKCSQEANIFIFLYIKELQENSLWPILTHNWNLGATIQFLDALRMDPRGMGCCISCSCVVNSSMKRLVKELKVKSKQGVCLDCHHRAMSSEEDNDLPSGLETSAEAESESSGSSSSGSDFSEDEDEEAGESESENEVEVEVEVDDAHCRVKH